MSHPGFGGGPELPPFASHDTPPPKVKSVWPFTLCVLLALPVVFLLAIVLRWTRRMLPEFIAYYGILGVLGVGAILLVVGTIGSIARASANSRQPRAGRTESALPFVLVAVLGPLAIIAMFFLGPFVGVRFGGLFGLAFCVLAIVAMLVTGITVAVKRSRANTARYSPKVGSATAPIGYTSDGQPIYPIVGYTPDGNPVTADRAIGYQPRPTGTNAMAIIALIVAFVVPVLAIIFGHIARSQIRRTGEDGAGLALAGLIIGYLSVGATIAILAVFFGLAANGYR